jgi:hypothetical protein
LFCHCCHLRLVVVHAVFLLKIKKPPAGGFWFIWFFGVVTRLRANG